jgi:hypothetical protein
MGSSSIASNCSIGVLDFALWTAGTSGTAPGRQGEPNIDRIEVGEFESHKTLREWLNKTAPVFMR